MEALLYGRAPKYLYKAKKRYKLCMFNPTLGITTELFAGQSEMALGSLSLFQSVKYLVNDLECL